MELLLIELKLSSFFTYSILYGSVPKIKGSNIALELFDIVPVLGSTFTKLKPEGILNGILLEFILPFSITSQVFFRGR